MSEHATRAEAEVKVRLTAAEYAALPAALAARGFAPAGEGALTDYYLHFAKSPLRGYDFTRLRVEDGAYALTVKRWATGAGGAPIRLEEEREIDAAEAEALLRDARPRTLRKHRRTFRGSLEGRPATVVLDTLDLAGARHYFLECELLVPPAEAEAAVAAVRAWLTTRLPIADLAEAPSMLELLLASEP